MNAPISNASFFGGVKAPELKHSSLQGRAIHQKAIVEFVRFLISNPGRVRVGIAHKQYALTGKLVDFIVEPVMHRDGIDLYRDGANVALATMLFHVLQCAGSITLNRARYRGGQGPTAIPHQGRPVGAEAQALQRAQQEGNYRATYLAQQNLRTPVVNGQPRLTAPRLIRRARAQAAWGASSASKPDASRTRIAITSTTSRTCAAPRRDPLTATSKRRPS